MMLKSYRDISNETKQKRAICKVRHMPAQTDDSLIYMLGFAGEECLAYVCACAIASDTAKYYKVSNSVAAKAVTAVDVANNFASCV